MHSHRLLALRAVPLRPATHVKQYTLFYVQGVEKETTTPGNGKDFPKMGDVSAFQLQA